MTLKEFLMLPEKQQKQELEYGGCFVIFYYTISFIVLTFRLKSKPYFIAHDEYAFKHGWKYFLISFLLGWWGIPSGIAFTLISLYYSFKGKNVTEKLLFPLLSTENNEQQIDDTNVTSTL